MPKATGIVSCRSQQRLYWPYAVTGWCIAIRSCSFSNRHGGLRKAALVTTPLDAGGVQQALRAVTESCGLKKRITPHSLRHSYATHLIEAGVIILDMQKILGHHSILTTGSNDNALERINALMDGINISWGEFK